MNTVYVHCGLHKTGTTALQQALSALRENLQLMGFLYPRTGTISAQSGHHNIAWELSDDRRFDPEAGCMNDLLDEITSFRGDVILSSEDFECSVTYRQKWLPFLNLAKRANRSVVFVIYLRNQASYMESLYIEMLKHGYDECYLPFFEEFVNGGSLRIVDWEFHCDYWRVATQLAKLSEVKVKFRNYHSPLHDSILADFFSAIGISSPSILNIALPKVNVRLDTTAALTLFYENRIGKSCSHKEKKVIQLLTEDEQNPVSSPQIYNAIKRRFSSDNAQLCQQYDLSSDPLVFRHEQDKRIENAPCMANVFSDRSLETISEIAKLAPWHIHLPLIEISDVTKARILAWQAWTRVAENIAHRTEARK